MAGQHYNGRVRYIVALCLFVRLYGVSGTVEDVECVQTIYRPDEVYNKPLALSLAAHYKPAEPKEDDRPVNLDPCSERSDSKLAFHLEIPISEATGDFGSRVILCLKTANSTLREELSCYNFGILSAEKRSEIHCWASISSIEHVLLVKAYAVIHDLGTTFNYYSEVHTLGLDTLCRSEEHSTDARMARVHGCNSSGRFTLTWGAEVKAITAKNESDFIWNLPYQMRDDFTEFQLAPDMDGIFNLTIVLFRPDVHMYFAIVRQIYVFCSIQTVSTPMPTAGSDSGPVGLSFPVFAAIVIGLICVLLATLAVIYMSYQHRRQNRSCCGGAPQRRTSSEMVALNNANANQRNLESGGNEQNGKARSPPNDVLPLPGASRLMRIPSDLSNKTDASSLLSKPKESYRKSIPIPREVSSISLDTTELSSKEIMILPLSYDLYIRDLVDCLRQILSFQNRVVCRRVYDQDVISEFNKNTNEWIDALLKNDNSIVLVLCFSSVGCLNREPTCVDEILEKCKLKGEKTHCRLIFLNFTGIDYGPNGYHGETFLVREEADCKGLVRSMFAACGFSAENEPETLTQALQSENYAQFIRKLLHHDESP